MNSAVTFSPQTKVRLVVLAVMCLSAMGSVHAGLFDDDEARRAILDLRQKAETSKMESDQKFADQAQRSTEDGAQFRRSLLNLQSDLEATRSELAKLRGQGEQLARELSDAQKRQKDLTQAYEDRLAKLEPAKVSLDGRDFLAEPSERRDYEAALVLFRKGEFAAVQSVFVDFLSRYTNTGYRPSALFWLGNAQYATKDYREAIVNFRSLVAGAPGHARAPEALLAIANCQLELKDARGARKTLEDLVVNFPGTDAASAGKERLARLR